MLSHHAIAQIAARQGGIISRRQLLDLGYDRDQIGRRIRSGVLRRRLPGAYAVGHDGATRDTAAWAAVLAAGDGRGGAVAVARRSAAAALDLLPAPSGPVTLLTNGRRAGPAGVDLRRTAHPFRTVRIRGLPVTDACRTLIDLAPTVSERTLEKALHQAEVLRLLDHACLRTAIDTSRAPGVARLRALVGEPVAHETESWLEEELLAALRAAGIPAPQTQQTLLGLRVDFCWPAAKLVVETDGRAAHLTAHAFENDRRRDAQLTTAGWRVLRFTYRQIRDELPAVISAVSAIVCE